MQDSDAPLRVPRKPSLFGSRLRERLLVLLVLREEIHLREAARVLSAAASETQQALIGLENAGVVSSRLIGRSRFISLNPRWFAAAELRGLLLRMAEAEPQLSQSVANMRTRPRRIGKPL